LEQDRSEETPRQTGMQYGPPPSPVISNPFRRKLVLSAIGPYELLVRITTLLAQWNDPALCSGVQLELESPDVLGTKQDWVLIVRILGNFSLTLGPNFGAATRVKEMLLSMNFVEESMLPTYCDGWIVTLSGWRLRVVPDHLLR